MKILENGVVRDATPEEIAHREADISRDNDLKPAAVRAIRNDKLANSDWTQITDSTADKAAWAAYRQALRDISGQAGFPWEVTWPDAP